MQDELVPPRTIKQVNPQDSVNEVLDTAAAVGWDLRQASAKRDEPKIEITRDKQGRYRLFSCYSKETVVLTAADLLDLARWVEQHRETLENEL